MTTTTEISEFSPASVQDWRTWLAERGGTEPSVRLVVRRKNSLEPGITYDEAVETALCFGWIDSTGGRRDSESFLVAFYPRKPKSTWSKRNRERATRMIELGRMTPAGQAMIDHAHRHNLWNAHPDAENEIVPPDLATALAQHPEALRHFQAFAPSARRILLWWISSAVKPETRARRITATVERAAVTQRAY